MGLQRYKQVMDDAQSTLHYPDPIPTTEQQTNSVKRGADGGECPEAKKARMASSIVDADSIKDGNG